MDVWMQSLSSQLSSLHGSWLAFPIVFLAGLLTNLCPCNVVMVPLIIGCVGGFSRGKERLRALMYSVVFAGGTVFTFCLLGVLAATAGIVMADEQTYVLWALAILSFVMGLSCLNLIKIPLPGLPKPDVRTGKFRGIGATLLLGLMGGVIATPCTTPVLMVILLYVASKQALVFGIALLVTYALGYVIPLILAGVFTGFLLGLDRLQQKTKYQVWVPSISGFLLLAFAIFLVVKILS
jgi:cytochrome c-type biogenesis protein